MHGRLKVKTTAEKEREKRLEKEEKCKLFKAGIDKAFEMRRKNDNENALSVTAPLLIANPDVYTLWNYRREVFLQRRDLMDQKSVDSSLQPAEPEVAQESFDDLCAKELDLTSTCLLKNPKSYCVWHHRYWILQIMKNPNWKREIQLCNEFLEMDERNFHCWDFRRSVCHSENIPIEEELNFSLKKVEENFSNFSSWFYRSSLFTEAHIRKIIDFTAFWNDEYSMVESALFTDPSDQSPWFYHKWLLATNYGKNISSFSVANENFKITVDNIIFDVTSGILAVIFNKSIRKCHYLVSFKCDSFEHNVQEKRWFPANQPFSKIWYIFTSFHKSCDAVVLTLDASMNDQFFVGLPDTIECKRMKGNDKFTRMNSTNFEHSLTEDKIKSLRCLQEMEPMNKWINLVLTAIDDKQPKENAKLDPLRHNYYCDQQSKIVLRSFLNRMDASSKCEITNSALTCFYFGEKFAHLLFLDLSGNNLRLLNAAFNSLIFLKVLIADNNQICEICDDFALLSVTTISLQNNCLITNCVESLRKCGNLRIVYVAGNDCFKANEFVTPFELNFEMNSTKLLNEENDNEIIHFVK